MTALFRDKTVLGWSALAQSCVTALVQQFPCAPVPLVIHS